MKAGKLRDSFSSVWRQQEKIILSRMKTVCVLSFFFSFNSSSKLKKSLVQIKWRFPYIFFQPLSKGSVQILLNKSERMLKYTSINSRKKKQQRQNCFISVTVKRFTLMSFCHLPQNWLWLGPLISGQVIQVYCRKQKKSVVSLFFQCLHSSLFPSLWFWRTSGGLTWQKGWSHAPAPPKTGSNLNRKWENISIWLAVASWPAAWWEGSRNSAALPALDCTGFVNGEALSAPTHIPLLLFAARLGGQLGDCYSRSIICLLPKGWNLADTVCFVHWQ